MDTYSTNNATVKLADWFEISEKEYMWYILQGYYIHVETLHVTWYLNDKLHRTDGPAVIRSDGTREWYLSGKRHRTDGPAFENSHGDREWWINGKPHRTDGPAIEWLMVLVGGI